MLPGRPPSWNDSYHIVRKRRGNSGAFFHTLAKKPKLIKYQDDMTLIVRAAKPSGWKPDSWVKVHWMVYLERHIDLDNLQKAVNDILEMATGVNDKWFVPIFVTPVIGVPRKDARIELILSPVPIEDDHDRR